MAAVSAALAHQGGRCQLLLPYRRGAACWQTWLHAAATAPDPTHVLVLPQDDHLRRAASDGDAARLQQLLAGGAPVDPRKPHHTVRVSAHACGPACRLCYCQPPSDVQQHAQALL